MPYLKDVKGFSSAQVEADILPVSVYASLVFFLLAGPAASGTSTKAVLVAGGACKLLTRVLLLWGRTLGAMRLMEVAFAAGAASDLMLREQNIVSEGTPLIVISDTLRQTQTVDSILLIHA